MRSALGRIEAFAKSAKARNAKRIQSSGLIAVLLGVLLWQTRWPSLRLGLVLLLFSHVGGALLLLYRNRELARDIEALEEQLFDESKMGRWFDREQSWAKRVMLFENISRTAGFLALGYGFWVPTGSVTVAVLLGVMYPAVTYFGLERRSYERRRQALTSEKSQALGLPG
jgi:hypothetical protein